jgi:hypothetical protein
MEFKGKVIAIANNSVDKKNGDGKWFTQTVVIEEVKDTYPQKMVGEIFGEEKIAEFGFAVGQLVEVEINFDASEYNGRWFGKNKIWKAKVVGGDGEKNGLPF